MALRILVDTLADEALTNAQMGNGREIIARLNPEQFHVTTFCLTGPDPRITGRPNTRVITLPQRRQTIPIFRQFIAGKHEILFYVKSSPAAKAYFSLRRLWRDGRVTIGTVESQSDWQNEPTIKPEQIRLWRKTVLKCDYLFSNSQSVKRNLEREFGLASEVVPTGVDARFFSPAWERPSNPRPRILFAGSLRPFKGPQILLDAAARFPQAEFVLAGDGVMASELKERAAREKLGNVHLLGPLGPEGVREEYRRADLFLFPSKWEGSPKVILEAAACGLPVIARNAYEPETVVDGQTGFLVANDEELFQRLEGLLSSPGERARMGRAGRTHAEKFDWDIITRQWEGIFLRFCPQRGQ